MRSSLDRNEPCASEASETGTVSAPSWVNSQSSPRRIAWMSHSADKPRRTAGGMKMEAGTGSVPEMS
ncbi:hypothetical protein D3C85_1695880 [compost metagenome]